MRIATSVSYIWSERQRRHILLSKKSIIWTGRVLLCKGASTQQTQLADSQQQFYSTLTNDYNTQFANQNAILGTLNRSLSPIIAAGPNQFGFSQGEVNNLNSQAIQGTGQQYANAAKTLAENQAAAGGGNALLPSGVAAQQKQQVASAAANQASNQLLGIQQAGYQQGYNQYQSAIGQLGGVAGMYNPTGYAGSANQGAGVANSEANTVAQLNNAASPWNLVGGILGGVAGSFIGMPGLGASLGSSIGGLASGGGISGASPMQNSSGDDSD